ncbi:hypothetical protein Kfla_1459 [Kribbella flavida DSM 17836]|uniref:Uncharacterized protein n=1 Tax=Kribbella flavida (strain DSM 17836 / JCM 10339 / NBRC 14399) TaxID=479435 RepID=D2PLD1_KRIFD|nr:hypothetical protein [Kribbella flavida]ADB30560.1 hypothetical protein Kfla_1459 [Kribbella flavida DSM 17836]
MNFETELKDRLHAGVDDTTVDIDRLIAGGRATGRRFTRRRRLGQALLSATATAAVVGVVLSVGTSPGPTEPSYAGPAAPPTLEPITPQAAWKIVIDHLPKGAKLKDVRGGHQGPLANPDLLWARAVYTDRGGPSNLSIELDWKETSLACTGDNAVCTTEKLPDGKRLVLFKDTGPDKYKRYEAWLMDKDGWLLTVRSDNAETWKGPGTRPEPPLSLAQLRTVALDPLWQQHVSPDLTAAAAKLFTPDVQPAEPPYTSRTPDPSTSETPR